MEGAGTGARLDELAGATKLVPSCDVAAGLTDRVFLQSTVVKRLGTESIVQCIHVFCAEDGP